MPGTGPGGRVTKQDVEAWAATRSALTQVADGVSLEVLEAGEGDPVVLLPGFGTDVSAFALQTGMLSERFRAVGINPRGEYYTPGDRPVMLVPEGRVMSEVFA